MEISVAWASLIRHHISRPFLARGRGDRAIVGGNSSDVFPQLVIAAFSSYSLEAISACSRWPLTAFIRFRLCLDFSRSCVFRFSFVSFCYAFYYVWPRPEDVCRHFKDAAMLTLPVWLCKTLPRPNASCRWNSIENLEYYVDFGSALTLLVEQ